MDNLQGFLLLLPVLLFSVIAHEFAHGYAALKQGDQTALMLGRLTWNPIKHIDPFMTVLLPAMLWFMTGGSMILGGAKPVPVNPRNYRRYKRGDIIVSLAGVATNFVVAIGCVGLLVIFGVLARASESMVPSLAILQAMMIFGVALNMILIAFNLLPIPPLDGSHVMKYLLPPAWSLRYQELGRFGLLLLILLLYFAPKLLTAWLSPALAFGGWMVQGVSGFILPSTWQWVPRGLL